MRTGVIAEKLGMSRYYMDGVHIPVTLLKVKGNTVVSVKTKGVDGYDAVQVGYGEVKAKNVSKPVKGHYAKAKIAPKRKLSEFKVSEDAVLKPGDQILPSHYIVGQFVDVKGKTRGKGFAGGMKRHGFGGLEATHGVSISHRSHGSTGQCQDPGRVFKGKKMAGHLGDGFVTKQNLVVVDTDDEEGLIVVCGAIPGGDGGLVEIRDSVKRACPAEAPYPAGLAGSSKGGDQEKDDKTEAENAEVTPEEEVQSTEALAGEVKESKSDNNSDKKSEEAQEKNDES